MVGRFYLNCLSVLWLFLNCTALCLARLLKSLACLFVLVMQLTYSDDQTWCLASLATLFVAHPVLSSVLADVMILANLGEDMCLL